MPTSHSPSGLPTLHDVAREAGVSLATASRSINGSERKVNESYRQRVLEAAARLGYTPNLSAQAVAKGTSKTVSLLVADIADPYFSSIAAGIIRSADEAGLVVTMAATNRNPARELDLVKTMRAQRPRVMILAGSRSSDSPYEEQLSAELAGFEKTGGRVAIISQNTLPFATVQLDNYSGAFELARSLTAIGYRRFAAITSIPTLRTAADRLSGFRDGLAEAGLTLDDDRVVVAEFTRDGGYAGIGELLKRGRSDVELIFAANDVMAVGAMSALRDAGITPGEDVAVAGYDDIPTVRDVSPALTTVRLPLEQVGELALALALDPDGDATGESTITTEVILRDSTPDRRGR